MPDHRISRRAIFCLRFIGLDVKCPAPLPSDVGPVLWRSPLVCASYTTLRQLRKQMARTPRLDEIGNGGMSIAIRSNDGKVP